MWKEDEKTLLKEEKNLDKFLVFYAPPLFVIASIIAAFLFAAKDEAVK
jgi:hypothetical protein